MATASQFGEGEQTVRSTPPQQTSEEAEAEQVAVETHQKANDWPEDDRTLQQDAKQVVIQQAPSHEIIKQTTTPPHQDPVAEQVGSSSGILFLQSFEAKQPATAPSLKASDAVKANEADQTATASSQKAHMTKQVSMPPQQTNVADQTATESSRKASITKQVSMPPQQINEAERTATESSQKDPEAEQMAKPPQQTIIIFGMVGAGKATVANALSDSKHPFKVGESVSSVTRSCTISEEKLIVKGSSVRALLIDLNPVKENLRNRLTKHLESAKVLQVSKVIMVVRHETFTRQAASAFDRAISFLSQKADSSSIRAKDFPLERTSELNQKDNGQTASKITALVVTCCENESRQRRETLEKELTTDEYTKKLSDFAGLGKYMVGFPKKCDTKEEVWETLQEQIMEDREKLRNLVSQDLQMTLTLSLNVKENVLFAKREGSICTLQ